MLKRSLLPPGSPPAPLLRRACTKCSAPALLGSSRCAAHPRLRAEDSAEYRANRARLLITSPRICALCNHGPIEGDPWTADHIIPVEDGGDHSLGNLQRAHQSCNSRKGRR